MASKTSFILLAGGASKRMGVDKGLLKYKKSFWMLEQISRLKNQGIDTVYIALGHNADHYFMAIPELKTALNQPVEMFGLKVSAILNKQPELGPFSTLLCVLNAIDDNREILICHIDNPILNSAELNVLINSTAEVAIPNFKGKNGHPIKLKHCIWSKFKELDVKNERSRLDYLIKALSYEKVESIKINDPSVILNLNTRPLWKDFLISENCSH